MTATPTTPDAVEKQILAGTRRAGKEYGFADGRERERPVGWWFQQTHEGEVLFVIFYTQACRWSRCLGCNLPSVSSRHHVDFRALMAQVDFLLADPEVRARSASLTKVIVSNNGSVLDEATFSSTALIYLVARLNLQLPRLAVLALETRVEYVDEVELAFLARALREGQTPTTLELAIGFEAFDDRIRNQVFLKGLRLAEFERLCAALARHGFRLKCYFMLKPVPGLSGEEAVADIHHAVRYLDAQARQHGLTINVHLNPTYAAAGTRLAEEFNAGRYTPPTLTEVARAALAARGTGISIYLGLSDEGLACPGGSFLRPGEEAVLERLEEFNRTQDFTILAALV